MFYLLYIISNFSKYRNIFLIENFQYHVKMMEIDEECTTARGGDEARNNCRFWLRRFMTSTSIGRYVINKYDVIKVDTRQSERDWLAGGYGAGPEVRDDQNGGGGEILGLIRECAARLRSQVVKLWKSCRGSRT